MERKKNTLQIMNWPFFENYNHRYAWNFEIIISISFTWARTHTQYDVCDLRTLSSMLLFCQTMEKETEQKHFLRDGLLRSSRSVACCMLKWPLATTRKHKTCSYEHKFPVHLPSCKMLYFFTLSPSSSSSSHKRLNGPCLVTCKWPFRESHRVYSPLNTCIVDDVVLCLERVLSFAFSKWYT